MTDITFNDLSNANARRCNESFNPVEAWSPCDWMTAACGELGEAANLIKKRRRGEDIDTEAIAHELADAVIYIDLLAARLGISLSRAVREKFNIVSARIGSDVVLP